MARQRLRERHRRTIREAALGSCTSSSIESPHRCEVHTRAQTGNVFVNRQFTVRICQRHELTDPWNFPPDLARDYLQSFDLGLTFARLPSKESRFGFSVLRALTGSTEARSKHTDPYVPGTTCALHATWPACGAVAGIAAVVPSAVTVTFSCTTKGGSGGGGVLTTFVKVPVI
jgi:hypothetical protein